MILNDLWLQFNEILRADVNTEIDKKMRAINDGYLYFAKRMLNVGNYLPELLSAPYGINTVLAQNYVSLPVDFLGIHTIYYKNGSGYTKVYESMVKDFEYLLEQTDGNFLDTTDQGAPSIFAIKEPYMYFDKHWNEAITDGIKLMYHKMPAILYAYDKITVTGVTGTYAVGEIVNQQTPEGVNIAYGYVRSYADGALTVYTNTRNGIFNAGYEIIGSESGASGTQSGVMEEKIQTIEIGNKYLSELANACAMKYLYYDDDQEALAKQQTFESELVDIKQINKYSAEFTIGLSR